MLAVLGPFAFLTPRTNSTTFKTLRDAFVPSETVELENSRIYKIFRVPADPDLSIVAVSGDEGHIGISFGLVKHTYYVVCEVDVNQYKAYLARVPSGVEEIRELKLPRCPTCGSWSVEIDADEMFCSRCENEFWHEEVVWRARDVDLQNVAEGEGIYVPSNRVHEYRTPAGHISVISFKKLTESTTRLGNVNANVIEFIGCIDESHWDEAPCQYGFGIYRKYIAIDFDKSFTVKLRDLTDEELLQLYNEVDSNFTKLCILRFLSRDVAVKLILESKLYEKFQFVALPYNDDERLRQAYLEYNLEKLREHKNDVEKAITYAANLRLDLGFENDEVRDVYQRYDKLIEEERRKRKEEEERRKREEEERRKREVEELRKAFKGLPVEVLASSSKISVRLTKFVNQETFKRYIETCKSLKLKFDPSSKSWSKSW